MLNCSKLSYNTLPYGISIKIQIHELLNNNYKVVWKLTTITTKEKRCDLDKYLEVGLRAVRQEI